MKLTAEQESDLNYKISACIEEFIKSEQIDFVGEITIETCVDVDEKKGVTSFYLITYIK